MFSDRHRTGSLQHDPASTYLRYQALGRYTTPTAREPYEWDFLGIAEGLRTGWLMKITNEPPPALS